jgi:amino acid adenylation domain-containing protein
MTEKIFQSWLGERLNRFKDNIAIEYGGNVFTYGDIDKQSDCIANWLIDRGVGKETFIGIHTDDRVEIIAAIIGILKAGCVFVPLDTANPRKRLEVMVESTGINLILGNAGESQLSRSQYLNDRGVEFVSFVELFSQLHRGESPKTGYVQYTPEDKIYVYFTSGSTGTPRAIVGKNKSLLHFINWEIEIFNINEQFRTSQLITPGFDAFLRDVFVPLCAGGVLCIPENPGIILNSYALIRWLEKFGINLVHCVPSLFRLLNSRSLDNNNLKTLKYILLSGEKINPAELANWYDTIGDRVQLVNLYGPTETTMIKSYYLIRPCDVQKERIPIGKPMKGVRIAILNEEMKLCDELITGEIYIRTPYSSFGYYRDDRLNRERFIPNPLNNDPNDIVFKTGDLGRLLPNGNIEFLGRKDRQVKIRGIRIELEEIERILSGHPAIHEAAVIKKDFPNGSELLCAYVTQKQGNPRKEEEPADHLREYLHGQLPDYMVPDRIRFTAEIKKKNNGKVDYDELALEFEREMESEAMRYVPPQDPIQEKLLEIWQEILGPGVGKIGIRRRFFEVGGNSLNVITLISFIHRDFDVRPGLAEMFVHDTVEKQAELIRHAARDMFVSIEPVEERNYYAVSSVQRRLFFLQQVEPENISYNMPQVLILEGDYNLERFETIFRKIIERHESFRTSIQLLAGEPVQRVHSARDIEFAVEYYKLEQTINDDEIPNDQVDKIVEDFIRPFDLSNPPLMRVGFIVSDREQLIFLMDIHHSVCDGTSQGIIITDIMAFYNGKEPPPLKLQYKDFSQWLSREEQQVQIRKQEEYWFKQFEGDITPLNLPADYERPPFKTFEGGQVHFDIGSEQLQALKALAGEEDVTLYMLMLALFNVTLARLTGQEDIVVGTSLAGRRHSDLKQIIGMFINALALRNYPFGEKTFRQFLTDVRQNTLEAFENQDYQFENLVEKVLGERIPGRNPLFDVMMVFDNEEIPEAKIPGLTFRFYPFQDKSAQMDLKLRITETRDNLFCCFEYSTKLFKKETVEMFVGNFKEVVDSVLENREMRLKDFKITHGLLSTKVDTSQMSFEF